MRQSLIVTTPPTSEPVSLGQLKQHTRIDADAEDDLVMGYLQAARTLAEGYTARAFLPQTLTWTLHPEGQLRYERSRLDQPFYLPRSPVTGISSITVLDRFGNSTVIPAATLPIVPPSPILGYIADLALEPARMRIGQQTALSNGAQLAWTQLESVTIVFQAGFADATKIKPTTKNAIMQMAAWLYENRGDIPAEAPGAFHWLLDLDRVQFYGY